MTNRPTIGEGDVGIDVKDLLGMLPTYYFGSDLKKAVQDYQRSRGLDADGIVGPQTWAALESGAPPYVPPGLPPPLSGAAQGDIENIAASSSVASHSWNDRGQAPIGYTKGVALAFANTYRQWQMKYPPAVDMAKANTGDADRDVLSWEAGRFSAVGMDNSQDGPDTLRHLWAYILGLGIRESSGEHCCGRDMSVPPGYYGPESTTTEAGAWQTSFDASGCSSHFITLFNAFKAGSGNPQGFVDAFEEGVSCSSAEWECYGSGDGYRHQEISKSQPAYGAEVCAITLRHLRKHYGPVGRREVEILKSADQMLKQVQDYIDGTVTV
jgi:peptidoglycan hydrolase-like protein with peptidoglycan-binding domain